MQRVLLFVNPVFERRAGHHATVGAIVELLGAAGLSVAVHETLSAQSAGEQARQGIADGFDAILICGGDGTVFNVIQGLAGTDIPVGILPFGTGNVVAQNLGLPRNPIEAARLLLHAEPRRVPLGKITLDIPELPHEVTSEGLPIPTRKKSWYFAMAAGMGLHASLMSAADSWGKQAIGRASYFFAGISLLLTRRVQPFEVEVTTADGEVFCQRVCEAIAVRVAELNRWRPGGQLEAPVLRLATVEASGRWGLGKASLQALARRPPTKGDQPSVTYIDASRVVCRTLAGYRYRNALLVEADGEVLGASQAVIEMAQESFHLLWPSEKNRY